MADKLQPLLYFVKEREAIRLKKVARAGRLALADAMDGNPPFTKDPILATYRFCNVRRRDDRVSQWLIQNVLTQENIDLDLKSFLEFSAFCRWVNWPPTIKAIMDAGLYPSKKIDWVAIGRLLDQRGKTKKVWTGAYMIRASKEKGSKKGRFISQEVIGKCFRKQAPVLTDLFINALTSQPTYQQVHGLLRKIPNFGSFMAGQVAGDWTYTPLLSDAPDLKTWAPMGPGSIRGFNRVIGVEKLTKRPPEDLWQEKLAAWRQKIIEKLGPQYEDLTALDCQNVLCEVDKMLRVKNGEGRPRAKYTSHTY
jgi:alpha-glutamyl/putrescinyl thymine pyrophosphorylase clade 1